MTAFGAACPDCGEWTGICRETGRDQHGQRVRRRSCSTCGLTFTTVEVVAPVSLHRLAHSPHPVLLDIRVDVA